METKHTQATEGAKELHRIILQRPGKEDSVIETESYAIITNEQYGEGVKLNLRLGEDFLDKLRIYCGLKDMILQMEEKNPALVFYREQLLMHGEIERHEGGEGAR